MLEWIPCDDKIKKDTLDFYGRIHLTPDSSLDLVHSWTHVTGGIGSRGILFMLDSNVRFYRGRDDSHPSPFSQPHDWT